MNLTDKYQKRVGKFFYPFSNYINMHFVKFSDTKCNLIPNVYNVLIDVMFVEKQIEMRNCSSLRVVK